MLNNWWKMSDLGLTDLKFGIVPLVRRRDCNAILLRLCRARNSRRSNYVRIVMIC